VRVIAVPITDAELQVLTSITKAFFRVIYIIPWVFTVAVPAILWWLILNSNGVANCKLKPLNLIVSKVLWLSSIKMALGTVVYINIIPTILHLASRNF